MKQIPEPLLKETIRCIRLATHNQVSYDQVENLVRDLEFILQKDDEQENTEDSEDTDAENE